MKSRITQAGLAALVVVLATLAAPLPTAAAYESYRSGSDVGVHYDADTTCAGYPYRDITVRPALGTTPGWEWGQNVAVRIFVSDSRGNVVGTISGSTTAWTTLRIATKYYGSTDINGNAVIVTDPYKLLGPYKWSVAPGTYSVRVDYAWQTNRGWSYATNVTSSYTVSTALGGYWYTTRDSRCTIS